MLAPVLAARIALGVVGITLLGAAVWIAQRRETAALRPFALFVGVVGTLAVADAVAAGALTSLSTVWLLTVLAIPCAFTWFVVEYYGLPYLASPRRKAAFLAPAVIALVGGIALILMPDSAGSMAGGGPTAPAMPAPLGFAAVAEQIGLYYAGGVMLAGVALLVQTVSNYEYLDRRLAGALSFVAVWPWLAYVVTPAIVSSVGVETILSLNASGYTLSLAAVGFAVTRGGIFDAAPAAGTLGPETVLADLDDAVVVVDRDHRIVTLNDAAADSFGVVPDAVTATPLSSCVGFDLKTLRDSDTVELSGPTGTRQLEPTVSPISDRFDRQPGYAIVFTDVTQERVRSQRLSVLNRVLRHNLRNEMNKIRGRAELIADGGQEYIDHAETIVSSADDLMSTGERARQVEQMMSTPSAVGEPASLVTIAETVVEEYQSMYPDATLSVDIDASLAAPINEQVLAHVLDNLVENAVVHSDAPTPVVTVGARATDTGIEVSVADNGPGIPNTERAVVETGGEDALAHGSGLGLWAVKWGVVQLGGELTFEDRKPRGTVVSIAIPTETNADPTPAAAATAD